MPRRRWREGIQRSARGDAQQDARALDVSDGKAMLAKPNACAWGLGLAEG